MSEKYELQEALHYAESLRAKIDAHLTSDGPEPKRSADLASMTSSVIALLECARSKAADDAAMTTYIDSCLDAVRPAFDHAKADFDAKMALFLAGSPSGSVH